LLGRVSKSTSLAALMWMQSAARLRRIDSSWPLRS
jgi:hypothetical protein